MHTLTGSALVAAQAQHLGWRRLVPHGDFGCRVLAIRVGRAGVIEPRLLEVLILPFDGLAAIRRHAAISLVLCRMGAEVPYDLRAE